MANKRISELPAAGGLAGTELVEVVKGGVNSQTTTQDIADLGGGGGGTWGSITGTLSSQTDLQNELDGKEDVATQTAVTIANGVTALNMAAGDVQYLTISEAKVINSITNSFIGTVGFVIPGTNSVTFTTINATITGEYNAGEQNIIWVTCIDATGTPEYTIVYENSLGGGGDVESVTGDGVDNSDPDNPVISFPEIAEITDLQDELDAKSEKYVAIRTITGTDSLILADFEVKTLIILNSATPFNLTVPPSIAGDGAYLDLININTGTVTFVQGAGVTITPSLGTLDDAGQNVFMVLAHTTSDDYYLGNGNSLTFTDDDITGALGYTPAPTTRTIAGVDLVDNITAAELKIALDTWQRVTIGSDFGPTTSMTYVDVTGLLFPITLNVRLEFRAVIYVDVANSTEGYNLSINGPALTSCRYEFEGYNSVSTKLSKLSSAYNDASIAVMNGSPLNGMCAMSGRIITSASGDVQFVIRTETGGHNVTVKAGSYVEYRIAGV